MNQFIQRHGLTGNALKLLALVTMTIDHVGCNLLPQYHILRIIGRLAFPLFAWMISEGCTYTRDRKKYFLQVFLLGIACQAVYFIAEQSLYLGILITFSLSILTIYAADSYVKQRNPKNALTAAAVLLLDLLLSVILPALFPSSDLCVDYGIFGILLPVCIYFGKTRCRKLALCGIDLCLVSLTMSTVQWWSLLTLIPLALYSGKRGKHKLKLLFYIYYPLHLVIIYLISLFM